MFNFGTKWLKIIGILVSEQQRHDPGVVNLTGRPIKFKFQCSEKEMFIWIWRHPFAWTIVGWATINWQVVPPIKAHGKQERWLGQRQCPCSFWLQIRTINCQQTVLAKSLCPQLPTILNSNFSQKDRHFKFWVQRPEINDPNWAQPKTCFTARIQGSTASFPLFRYHGDQNTLMNNDRSLASESCLVLQ